MDDLKGTMVLVHPKLDDDPAGNQNKIGLIIDYNLAEDDFFVDVNNGGPPALYAANALLILKKPDEIYLALGKNLECLSASDATDIHNTALLLQYGVTNISQSALKIVQQNEAIGEYVADTLQDAIDREQHYKIGR